MLILSAIQKKFSKIQHSHQQNIKQRQFIQCYVLDWQSNNNSFMELSACGLCQLQVPTNNTSPADLPLYSPQTDSLKLTPRKLCKQCHVLLAQITEFAAHYQIKYCDPNFKSTAIDGLRAVIPQPKQALQLLYASQSNNSQRARSNSDNKNKLIPKRFSQGELPVGQSEQEEIIHPYINIVIDETKNKNVLCLSHLPKTLQLVVYLATQQSPKNVVVSPEERREKIKNVILFLAERIHLNLEELPYVVVLVNFLLCMMDPNKATSIVIRLSDIILAYPHLLSWKSLILQQQLIQSKNPHSPASLDLRSVILKVEKLWLKIEAILQLSKKGEAVLHEGVIRISKINVIEYKEYRKRVGEVLKAFLAKKQEKQDLKSERLTQLYLLKLQKNSFSLILKHIMESQEQMRQQLAQINQRHKKEKDQYVQKIIKLSNKIQQLQIKIKELGNDKVNQTVVTQFREVEEVIQPPVLEQQVGAQTDSILQNQGEELHVQLQTILTLTNLVGFNDQHLSAGKTSAKIEESRELTQIIIEEINRLQDGYIKLTAKAKHAEQEKNRLLGIVTRKDDRFISVITQKDIIIERYEQALWRMQNGLNVEEQPLAHRIRYIMHIFAKRSKAEQCDLDNESTDGREEKEKKEGKDCDIY